MSDDPTGEAIREELIEALTAPFGDVPIKQVIEDGETRERAMLSRADPAELNDRQRRDAQALRLVELFKRSPRLRKDLERGGRMRGYVCPDGNTVLRVYRIPDGDEPGGILMEPVGALRFRDGKWWRVSRPWWEDQWPPVKIRTGLRCHCHNRATLVARR